MQDSLLKHVDSLIKRYPLLEICRKDIVDGYDILEECYLNDGKLLIAGNGGSSADSEHIVGELMKGFCSKRRIPDDFLTELRKTSSEFAPVLGNALQGALPAIALDGHNALTTAYINDCDPLLCFAQQLYGFGRRGDAFLGISTSGNSQNIWYAAIVAKAKGMKIVGLSGKNESKLSSIADVCVRVPQTETYMVQELHLPVYHCWCLMLEERFWGSC